MKYTGTRRKASSISSFVRPFLSRKERLYMTGDPLTFGCERNLTAFCTWSSRIGSEFTNTEGGEISLASWWTSDAGFATSETVINRVEVLTTIFYFIFKYKTIKVDISTNFPTNHSDRNSKNSSELYQTNYDSLAAGTC